MIFFFVIEANLQTEHTSTSPVMLLVFNPNRSKLRARPYQPSMKNRDAYCVTSEVGDKAERMEFSMTDLKLGIFKKKSENTQGQTDLRSKKPEVRVLLSEQTFTTFRVSQYARRLLGFSCLNIASLWTLIGMRSALTRALIPPVPHCYCWRQSGLPFQPACFDRTNISRRQCGCRCVWVCVTGCRRR